MKREISRVRAAARSAAASVALILCGSIFGPNALADDAPATTNAVQLKKLSMEDLMAIKVETVYAASKFEQKPPMPQPA